AASTIAGAWSVSITRPFGPTSAAARDPVSPVPAASSSTVCSGFSSRWSTSQGVMFRAAWETASCSRSHAVAAACQLVRLCARYALASSTVTERTVIVDGRRVAMADLGGGRPVVLLHGLLGSPHYLLPLARSVARSGRRVLVPWLPGHGPSDRLEP